ncbi:[FeFe] hydrogenase H-cluster radical SAM maturase HydE [Pelosinus fermentans]|uniref:(FeFe)-hydrogenase maturation HydE, radical SAM n=1 Tax=Pelosinus fermentans JBW45 TaxID=1192197 RepID=I9NQN6_9FIRM|nr:[FeFe] hydrogenase H-cluster radical SAM maturase HydE [Pelosinus fermentans]AJQ28364.1 (FeFe)-hydrogenase maturation HydE, radical SAM [Pelosinus fermentans JBW45]
MAKIVDIINKAETTHSLTKEEIVDLLRCDEYDQQLFLAADRVRSQYVGDQVHLRGLIEFSNICQQNCFYCGLRKENTKVKRYKLTPDTIIDLADKAKSYNYKTVVLQSGESQSYTVADMQYIIRSIKALGLAITLSLGEKSREEYQIYKEAGADRYLLRIETTNSRIYKELHPGMSFENRLRCLQDLKDLGYELGTGCLVGLPNQTMECLADDILFFKSLDADMIGLGPFIPNADTPLAQERGGTFNTSIKVMAITRLLLPDANIPATTAMETLNKNGRIIALQSGANVVMPNVTEGEYRKMYMLYPGKICVNDTPKHCVGCITGKIQGIGRHISTEFGFRQSKKLTNNLQEYAEKERNM